MSGLHTLGVLGGIGQREQLLLKLCRDIDAGEVRSLRPHAHLRPSLIAEENALLLHVLPRVHA